jgi:alkyl sulfatase BDS1-like metallo-beta-lactamase superfamily hydrolase
MGDAATISARSLRERDTSTRFPISATLPLFLLLTLVCTFAFMPWAGAQEKPDTLRALLLERNAEFERAVIKVTKGVYTAVGFGVSTVSMVETADGIVVIDTGIDMQSAKQVITRFREVSEKPVTAIILTHGHGDHTGGFRAFYEEGESPKVIVARDFGHEQREFQDAGLSIQKTRGAMQAGFLLFEDQRINNGIARAYWPKRGGKAFEAGNAIDPTVIVSQPSEELVLGDSKFSFHIAPGETKDQMFIVLEDRKVLFAGDNFYKSWPNVYAIRGTSYRDMKLWIESLTAMLTHSSEALVGGHTRPIIGKAKVEETLTNYRDALDSIFTQTIAGINRGLTPDELVHEVKLAKHLSELDYLRPYYGHPEWAVRAVFNGYLGWFDGNPTNLFPLDPKSEAHRMVQLAGGQSALFERARAALDDGDAQWAAQLADHLLAIDSADPAARELKASALETLSDRTLTTTARNYYLSGALKLRQSSDQDQNAQRDMP